MFKWFWTIFSLGAPASTNYETLYRKRNHWKQGTALKVNEKWKTTEVSIKKMQIDKSHSIFQKIL